MATPADSLKEDLVTLKTTEFLARWLVERTPALFGGDQAAHVAWRRRLAEDLGVSIFDLVIVGSAALGSSLNPSKNFASFGPQSDVDLAVISAHHFDLSWRWMRRLGSQFYGLPTTARQWVEEHRTRLLYWGTIATEHLLQHLPFGPDWVVRLAAHSNQLPVNGRDINVRLYRDHGALESYQARSVRRARDTLQTPLTGGPP